MRTGLVAKKLGMSYCYVNDERVPVTLLEVDQCVVTDIKSFDKDGYDAVQLGYGTRKAANINKPMKGILKKSQVESVAGLVEFRVSADALLAIGDYLSAGHFVKGQMVDVTATSIGKGFAGGMKRHNFGGLEATHGVSISHRSHGSTGQCQDPGKVFKGKKMAGQLGNKQVTVQNLEVIDIDEENNIIAVIGGVPGSKGHYVRLKDAVKKALPGNAPFPAKIVSDKADVSQAESSDDEVKDEA